MNLLAELWFDWTLDAWPVLMALLVGLSCGLLGAVYLLRRAALLGDAVSHSVLPGIAGGLLLSALFGDSDEGKVFSASTTMFFILAGALAAGLLATALIEALNRFSRIKSDTALGAVFPAFFAAGVILVEILASDTHFDADCVFYGSLEVIGTFRQVIPTLIASLLVVGFFVFTYKEILISTFDPALARSLGVRVRLVNNVLVALLTTTVVCAFEAVGAILVVAFLIIPPATAYLLADRFHLVLSLSAAIGVFSGVLGCWLTIVLGDVGFETARAPTMAVVAGTCFLLAFLFAPRRGVIAQYRRRRALADRILDENFLGAVYRLGRAGDAAGEPRAASPAISLDETADCLRYPRHQLRPALHRAVRRGELTDHGDGRVALTPEGRRRIEKILRAHRLWESYMIREMGVQADHVHDAADEIEHYLQPVLIAELDKVLEHPTTDPHGKEIPSG